MTNRETASGSMSVARDRRRVAVGLAVLFALTACAGPVQDVGDQDAPPPPSEEPPGDQPGDDSPDTPDSPDAPMEEPAPIPASWDDDFVGVLGSGITIVPCEGDAPMWCFSDGERHLGAVELLHHPFEGTGAGDIIAELRAQEADFLATFQADRGATCPDLVFEPIPAIEVFIGGERGLRGGFRLVGEEGREVERHVIYRAVRDDTQYVINAASYADDGCVARLGEFTPEDFGLVSFDLDHLVARTPLPAP